MSSRRPLSELLVLAACYVGAAAAWVTWRALERLDARLAR